MEEAKHARQEPCILNLKTRDPKPKIRNPDLKIRNAIMLKVCARGSEMEEAKQARQALLDQLAAVQVSPPSGKRQI